MKKAVLIILNYGQMGLTERLLKKTENYSCLYKTVIVDNCSPHVKDEDLKKYKSDRVDVIRTNRNSGYASGNNFGAVWAVQNYQPAYLIFANPDVLFEEDAVIKVIEKLESSREYALGSVMEEGGYNIWKRPDYPGTIRSLFLAIHTIEKMRYKAKALRQKAYCEVEVVEGSFFVIDAEIFERIGRFDERTFLYYEENILSYKLAAAGYKEIVCTDICYQHLHGGTIRKVYGKKAKAFLNYKKSLDVYLSEYLKVGRVKKKIFNLFYLLAYAERIIYDCLLSKGKEK